MIEVTEVIEESGEWREKEGEWREKRGESRAEKDESGEDGILSGLTLLHHDYFTKILQD